MGISIDQGVSIFNIAAPIILGLIQRHHAATGELPTLDELQAQINRRGDEVVAGIEAFQAAHRDPAA